MRPIIGVTPSINNESHTHFVSQDNLLAISQQGGCPVILPYIKDRELFDQISHWLDGLYLTGGNDVNPITFHEAPHPQLREINPSRDQVEIILTKKMLHLNKPILGVCKGAQILNIALGGDMYQDIYSQIETPLIQHHQNAPKDYGIHEVNIIEDSLLFKIIGHKKIRVNSRHHQANRIPGKGIRYTGMAQDGIVEAIESTEHYFALGLQWHPENMVVVGDKSAQNIFCSFINHCKN